MNETADVAVYVVDDDPAVCDALAVVFELEGFKVTTFSTGDAFIEVAKSREPGCVLLDVHMPGRSGIDILSELNAENYGAPIFIISGQGDIPMAVNAIKQGAFDFIEKPFDADTVVKAVRDALAAFASKDDGGTAFGDREFPGREHLTPRERQVLEQITSGATNKEAGRVLGISPRTIEVHRARIMEKLGARNAADLVRIVLMGEAP